MYPYSHEAASRPRFSLKTAVARPTFGPAANMPMPTTSSLDPTADAGRHHLARSPQTSVTLEWSRPVRLDRLVVQEAIALGQRVESWTIAAEVGGTWTAVARGTTIGYKRIATFPPLTTARVRLDIVQARACPAISSVAAYLAPAR